MIILGLQALLCSLEWVLTRRLPMQSGIGANKQQMRPAKPEIFHKNMLLMALLLLIVMISMTEILIAMENLQHSRTLQQSKQRFRSDLKFTNTLELIAVTIFSWNVFADFVFTSEVISLVTVFPQLAHTVVTGSLSKTTLTIEEHLKHPQLQHQKHYCKNYSNFVINKIIAKSKRAKQWLIKEGSLHQHYNNRSIHLDHQEHDQKKDIEATWDCAHCCAIFLLFHQVGQLTDLGVCMGTCTEIPPACAL